jgi:hypothetical protein
VCRSVAGEVLMIKQETSCIYYVTQGGQQLVVTFLRAIKIRSAPSFGGEIKPEAPCCKILWHV